MLGDLPPETVAETTRARFLPFVRDRSMRALMVALLLASGDPVGTIGALRTAASRANAARWSAPVDDLLSEGGDLGP